MVDDIKYDKTVITKQDVSETANNRYQDKVGDSNDSPFDKDLESQIYIDFRRQLLEIIRENNNFIDKYILTISAGAFGVSLTFIDQVVTSRELFVYTSKYLYLSWILFGLCIITLMISMKSSTSEVIRKMKQIDAYFLPQKYSEDEISGINYTKYLNIVTMICFITGLVLLLSFSMVHITYEFKI